jgi:hypothetical protein
MCEGLVPVILGTVVTAAGSTVKARDMRRHGYERDDLLPTIAAAVIGFGLAHIILGSIDLVEHRR